VGADPHDAQTLVRICPALTLLQEEIPAALRPIHSPMAVSEQPPAPDPPLKDPEDAVEANEIVKPAWHTV